MRTRVLPTLCLVLLSPITTAGVEDRDNGSPSASAWAHGITMTAVQTLINQGNRIVDLEVVQTSPSLRVTVAYVPNTGAFKKTWHIVTNKTASTMTSFINLTKSRITDLEVYSTPNGIRFAALLEHNASPNNKNWWWYPSITPSQIYTQTQALGARVVDIEQYTDGRTTRYAAVLLRNIGGDAKTAVSYYGVSAATLKIQMSSGKSRIWDIDRVGNDRYNAVLVQTGREYSWSFFNLSAAGVSATMAQYGGRITDIEQYSSLIGTRFNIVLTNSSNDLSRRVAELMRARSDGWSGVYLQRVLPRSSKNLAYINADRKFEPASTLKVLNLLRALREVQTSANTNLITYLSVKWHTNQPTSCPTVSPIRQQSMKTVLREMMIPSNNAHAKVITERYGMASLNLFAYSLGMTNTKLNHHFGCGTPANTSTLADLGKLYTKVIQGYLGSQRQNFYDLHAPGFYGHYYAQGYLKDVIDQEAAKTGLNSTQRAAFVQAMMVRGKKGHYVVGGKYQRSWAAYLRLPFWANGGINYREYTTGSFVSEASDQTKAIHAAATGAAEVLRDEIRAAMLTLKNHVASSAKPFGSSCKGNLATAYVHSLQGVPELGQQVSYEAYATRQGTAPAMFYLGVSKTSWQGASLPISLAFLQAPGCYLRVSPDFAVPLSTVSGKCKLVLKLPTNKALLGLQAHTQFLFADSGANAAGLTASNGVTTVLGGQK